MSKTSPESTRSGQRVDTKCYAYHIRNNFVDAEPRETGAALLVVQLRTRLFIIMAPSRGPAPTPRTLYKTLSNHKGPVHVARYAKGTAKYVLSGGQDRTVRLWNPDLGTEIKSYSAHGYEVLSITVCVLSFVLWLNTSARG